MSGRLSAAEVTAHLSGLRLTGVQASRLRAIVALLADDGRFRLRDALMAGEFSDHDARAQDAFQDFRRRVNVAADRAGVPLALELDAQKTTPDTRYGWFTGGDLVDAGLAAFTGSAADRTGVPHPVEQAVAEVGASRRTRVYVSHTPADAGRKVGLLLERLRTDLALDGTRTWEVDDTASPLLGEDTDEARDRLAARADVRVALLSPAWLLDRAERNRVLGASGPTAAFALGGLPDGEVDLAPLRRWEIGERDRPWDVLNRPDHRQRYARRLVDEIRKALEPPAPPDCPPDEVFARHTAALAQRRRLDDSVTLVPGEVGQTTLSASLLDSPSAGGPPLPAVDRLVEWALDARTDAPPLCALLGDVGMGKTTTAKLLARRLLDLRAGDPRVPLPILFDLRDVRTTDLADKLSTDHVLTSMFEHNRLTDAVVELTAPAVRRRIAQGGAVVIFDGLDEVLVHLEPSDQRLFTAQLFRAVEERSGSRMLLTCRTQYFRTLRDETGYFVGHDREGLRGENYLALVMLPFRPEQVRAYLAANLGWEDGRVGEFLDTIAAVHDLTDLASRPVTLKMIADQVRVIEGAKLRGEPVRAVDLYGEFVDRWLDRDAGKHSLRPEHKRLLMEHAAARLWREGRTSWGPDDLDDWLLEVLDARPDLKRRYRGWQPDLWTADFRTATFLARQGDTFSFAHRSLFEYFLARHVARALTDAGSSDDSVLAVWTLPVPSVETLDFLGQSLAALPDPRHALDALASIGRRYTLRASELALAYALRAQRGGYPHQSLVGVVLAGAQLRGWRFGASAEVAGGREADPDAPWLSMAGADITGADLRDAVFDRVDLARADLSGADLTTAEFHRCRLTGVQLDGSRAIGTILRSTALGGVDLTTADAYRAQALLCDPAPAPRPGWLVAPLPTPGRIPAGVDRLRVLTGHHDLVCSVSWSPDGSLVVSGGGDGVRVWDAVTGERVRELAVHRSRARSVGWSPDGVRIVSAGSDGTQVWDAVTGELVRELAEPDGGVSAVGWSPDGSRIVSGGDDGVLRVWDAAAGELMGELIGHRGRALMVGWSPDGSRIMSGGDDGVLRVWDAAAGELMWELTGFEGEVWPVGWSPGGSRIVSGGDGALRVWDAVTGELLWELPGPAGEVRSVGWSPDGSRIVCAGNGGTWVWGVVSGELVWKLPGHGDGVWSVGWSPDGSRIASGGAGGRVRWLYAETGELYAETREPMRALARKPGSAGAVGWSPDGSRLVFGGDDGVVRVWDAAGRLVRELAGHTGRMLSVEWSPDGARIAAVGFQGLMVWDAVTGEALHELARSAGAVVTVGWSPDGSRIASGDDLWGIRIWDAVTGEPVQALMGHRGSLCSVGWSPDGSWILSAGEGGTVRVWNRTTGEPVRELAGHTGWVRSVGWSPDGSRIVSGGDDGVVRVWDAMTGESVRELGGHAGWVLSVGWSPDGSRIVSGGDDGVVRVWDAMTGESVRELAGHFGQVRSVGWSPDGSQIASGGTDGAVRVWDASTGRSTVAVVALPDGEIAAFDADETLVAASPGAWRWLGWSAVEDCRMSRLPAETYGPLPPLRQVSGSARG